MVWTSLVTLFAVVYYIAVGLRVAAVRRQTGISAPAMSGNPELERALRVQGNAVEFAPVFFPVLWLAAFWTSDALAAGLGLVWVAGRIVYARAYWQEAGRRTLGFMIQVTASALLFLTALTGIVLKLVHG